MVAPTCNKAGQEVQAEGDGQNEQGYSDLHGEAPLI